jgi:hypothetical protein
MVAKLQQAVDTSALFLDKKAHAHEFIRIFVQRKIWLT